MDLGKTNIEHEPNLALILQDRNFPLEPIKVQDLFCEAQEELDLTRMPDCTESALTQSHSNSTESSYT